MFTNGCLYELPEKWWMSGRSQAHSAGESPVFPGWDSLASLAPLVKLAAMEIQNLGEKTKENDLLMTYLWPTYDLLMTYFHHLFHHHFPASSANVVSARYGSLWVVHIRLEAQPMGQAWSSMVNQWGSATEGRYGYAQTFHWSYMIIWSSPKNIGNFPIHTFWVNDHISLTWIKAIWGWFP